MFKKIMSMAVITSFMYAQNAWCVTTPSPHEEEEEGKTPSGNHKTKSSKSSLEKKTTSTETPFENLLQELELVKSIQHTGSRSRYVLKLLKDFVDLDKKLLIGLIFTPIVHAQSSDAEDTARTFYGVVLPTVAGGFIFTALAAPIIKDSIYKGYKSLISSRFDKVSEWLDTTVITRWPHESLRWGYFGILRGNRNIGDIPITGARNTKRNFLSRGWRSVYEWTTSQPYEVELRHAVSLKNFRPYLVKIVRSIDEELEKASGWEREEIKDQQGLFRGFSYQSGGGTLHIRGGSPDEYLEGMIPHTQPDDSIESEERFTIWTEFFRPFKENEIELLPSTAHSLLQMLVLDNTKGDDRIRMLVTNKTNTLYFDYKRGLIIALEKKHHSLPPKEDVSHLERKEKAKSKKKTYEGRAEEAYYTFRLFPTYGDGDCGYEALGTSRKKAKDLLLKAAKNKEIREMLSHEIKADILNGTLPKAMKTKEAEELIEASGSSRINDLVIQINSKLGLKEEEEKFGERGIASMAESESLEEEVKRMCVSVRELLGTRDNALEEYCIRKDIFEAYVKHTIGKREWLSFFPEEELGTSGTLDAISYLKGYKVYVWKSSMEDEKKRVLLLHETRTPASISKTLHLLYKYKPGHFDRLKIIKEGKLPESKEESLNPPKIKKGKGKETDKKKKEKKQKVLDV